MGPIGEVHWRVAVAGDSSNYYDGQITGEDLHMAQDALEQMVGDGLARVTCSLGIKDSNYGRGFEAFCTVQLTCNQDSKTVRGAQALAEELAAKGMEDAFDAGRDLFAELSARRK